jgi:hypothetical protein
LSGAVEHGHAPEVDLPPAEQPGQNHFDGALPTEVDLPTVGRLEQVLAAEAELPVRLAQPLDPTTEAGLPREQAARRRREDASPAAEFELTAHLPGTFSRQRL